MNKNRTELENAQPSAQNDPSAATSRKNLAPAPYKEPASGELAAAPCSAGGESLSEQKAPNKDGWYYTAPYSELAIAESQMHLQAAKEHYQGSFRFSVLIEPIGPHEEQLNLLLRDRYKRNLCHLPLNP